MQGEVEREVRFPEISAPILEKVCQYFYWSLQFARLVSAQTVPSFGLVLKYVICLSGLGVKDDGWEEGLNQQGSN